MLARIFLVLCGAYVIIRLPWWLCAAESRACPSVLFSKEGGVHGGVIEMYYKVVRVIGL